MKLTSIPQLYRNLRRGREILRVLRRYGLADWISRTRRLPLQNWIKDRSGVPLTQYTRSQRIRMAITELGPTFIKVGQVLAARPDLVGNEIAEELKQLRNEVSPDSMEVVEATLAEELGPNFRKHFRHIEPVPLATASIGQVHHAELMDGQRVVLKVQRRGIEKMMREDLDVLEGLAQWADHVESLAIWGPSDMVRQLMPMILRELDFNRERSNLKQFAQILESDQAEIAIPSVFDQLCTRRVLVMEEMVGEPLAKIFERDDSETTGESTEMTRADLPPELGRTLARTYLRMVFEDGFFHADPHPGNLFCLRDGRLAILDFGMTGRIDEAMRESIEEMLAAINSGDCRRLTRLIRRVGNPRVDLDQSALEIDVADFVDTYGRQTLDRFDLAGALNQLSEILHRHGIGLPNQSALLLKMLISLEGTLREIGVGFDSLDIVRSYLRRVMIRRLTPARRLRQARRIYLESEAFMENAPEQLLSLMNQARLGQLQVRLEPKRFAPVVNRLVVGLMTSAVFLGSALMLSYEVSPVLFPDQPTLGIQRVSILGLVGLVASFSVMVALCLAILRSE
ncbi:ABC1 kinase family protein [Rhodopirellula bahusiensis]|uniref:ABC transporter n=2 Tax=Rhodopirellula bahusiensis TaxID=2014065 RepID=A0A2G1WDI4_9BACT|nr:AarF/UbiB family protein [Rhodopirellula bahusiensis]PHQ37114.1 ABC transporter [Rhodopirellula bahusiensis]